MSDINWDAVFKEQIKRCRGAEDWEIEELTTTLANPISASEYKSLRKQEAEEPERWILPTGPLPESYLSILRWSNGGEFRNGDRLMQFFPAIGKKEGVRTVLLSWTVPYSFPGIVPFATNGGGIFYAFDMRFRALDGEYWIVAAEMGSSHKPYRLEETFLDACKSRIDFTVEWNEEDEFTRPFCKDCGEFLVCPECGQRGPVRH